MSAPVVITGGFGLRIDEAAESPEIRPATGLAVGKAGVCADLRAFGIAHTGGGRVPLALGVERGDMIEVTALAMRIDAHRVHFWAPETLPVQAAKSELEPVLRHLFQVHHLPLNNFECNHHPIPVARQMTQVWQPAGAFSPASLAVEVLDWLDRGQAGAMPQPGNECQRLAGRATCLAQIGGRDVLSVERGGRRKKPAWNSPLWHVSRYREQGSGTWHRVAETETLISGLRDFDDTPEVAASMLSDAPLERLGAVDQTTQRIAIESLETGALMHLDITLFSLGRTGRQTQSGAVVLRLVSGRHADVLSTGASEIERLAEAMSARFGALIGPTTRVGEPLPRLMTGTRADAPRTAALV